MKDLVSIIIPTYNRSHFVTEAIDSVLCQTYPSVELIVVNDGSTDDTETKLLPYRNNITYIKKENGGVSSAVNAGLQIARGKYIARLDDDDLFMPDRIEKALEIFQKNPDVGLVTSGCFITDSVGRTLVVRDAPDFSDYGPFLGSLIGYSLLQPTVMVRRECHDKLGFYKETLGEDCEMFLRILLHWKAGVVHEPLAKYRRHPGNITIDLSKNKVFLQEVSDFTRDILDDVPLKKLFPSLGSTSDPYRKSCAYAAKGGLYLRNCIHEKAEAHFLKALEICANNSIPLLWLGILSRDDGAFQSAEQYLDRVQEKDVYCRNRSGTNRPFNYVRVRP